MKRILLGLIAALFLTLPALAQLPPAAGIAIGKTPIQGGTNGLCLYQDSNGKVGEQACSSGSVTTFSAGTTGLTPNSATSGAVTLGGTLIGANGGTGVANTGKTVTLGGNLTTSGAFGSTFTMTGTTGVTFPTTGTLATLTDISNAIAGVNPAVAVQAATTAAGDTSGLTYNNGAAGIGAFFTGAVNTALTIDGYTFTAVGQRLLVKNDTQSPSGAFNGLYYVTQIQTAILPIILTRALDYNSPSDINNTGAIPAINGTTNGGSSWLLTSSVATVGTDPLTYTQFTYPLASVVTLTGSQTVTNKTLTAPIITSTAWASVPAPGNAGKLVRVSDFGTKGALLMDDGTRWKPVNGCTVLATLDAASSAIPNTETIVFQYLMPANILQSADHLRLFSTMTKSGATDTGALRVHLGTAGTTADATIAASTVLAAANLVGGFFWDFRLSGATTIQQLAANSAASAGYTVVGNGAFQAPTTISSAVTNALYVSVTVASSGATNTVILQDSQLHLCATAN